MGDLLVAPGVNARRGVPPAIRGLNLLLPGGGSEQVGCSNYPLHLSLFSLQGFDQERLNTKTCVKMACVTRGLSANSGLEDFGGSSFCLLEARPWDPLDPTLPSVGAQGRAHRSSQKGNSSGDADLLER